MFVCVCAQPKPLWDPKILFLLQNHEKLFSFVNYEYRSQKFQFSLHFHIKKKVPEACTCSDGNEETDLPEPLPCNKQLSGKHLGKEWRAGGCKLLGNQQSFSMLGQDK